MIKILITILLLLSPTLAFAEPMCKAIGNRPDPQCTPGATMPVSVKDICTPHYTAQVRNVPESVKREVFRRYGMDNKKTPCPCEIDHFISLELGGSNDIKNLWPEPYANPDGARVKDQVENYLHRQVCVGNISLEVAQQAIADDWTKVYTEMHK